MNWRKPKQGKPAGRGIKPAFTMAFAAAFVAAPRKTLVDVIFDEWFLYCFSMDAESSPQSEHLTAEAAGS